MDSGKYYLRLNGLKLTISMFYYDERSSNSKLEKRRNSKI